MPFHRHAVRHQRQGKFTDQLHGLRLIRQLHIELADREGLAAQLPLNAHLLAFIGDVLAGWRQ